MADNLPKIYFISDLKRFADEKSFFNNLEQLLSAGLRMVQLREKELTAHQLYQLTQKARQLTSSYNAKLLINDRIDVALATGADGVHLGGHSLSSTCAREILGPDKIIGVSTHNDAEINAAQTGNADFITFSPIYHTPSKAGYGPPQGIVQLKDICDRVTLPVYALGGIKLENVDQLKTAGAYGIAAISALQTNRSVAMFSSFSKFLQQD